MEVSMKIQPVTVSSVFASIGMSSVDVVVTD
jgi:hypothetical protein